MHVAVKTALQILSYIAGVFWFLDVFLVKSKGKGQNIQINMGGNDEDGYNERKTVGNWQAGLNSKEDPPPPYNL